MFLAQCVLIGICLLGMASAASAKTPTPIFLQPERKHFDVQASTTCTQALTDCSPTFPVRLKSPASKDVTGVGMTAQAPLTSALPELGDGSDGALTPWAERNWGQRIMLRIRRDPDYLADMRVRDYFATVAHRLAAAAIQLARQGLELPMLHAQSDHSALYTGSGMRVERGGAFAELSQIFTHISPDFEVFAVRDPEINAFSLPGGSIGINTGLIAKTQTESELASVLAHEMGHVLQRHSARKRAAGARSSYAALAGMVFGVLAGAATGSADLGGALVVSAQAYGMDSQLKFSRAAEREADRIGFLLLDAAGYDPYGMPAFFERLEKASPSESSVPAYMRTHPLTHERIADMTERARRARYRQPRQDPEYGFVRAQLRVLQASSEHEYEQIRQSFNSALTSETAANRAADFYGLALTYLQTKQNASVFHYLEQAQHTFDIGPNLADCITPKRAASCKPLIQRHALSLDILRIEMMRQGLQSDQAKALTLAQAIVKRWPYSRAAQETQIKAQFAAKHYKEAQRQAQEQARLDPNQTVWWRYIAQASAALGDTVSQQRALAEQYALEGAWSSAIIQLETAGKTPALDFYQRAQIESRIQEMKALYQKSEEEEKNGLPI